MQNGRGVAQLIQVAAVEAAMAAAPIRIVWVANRITLWLSRPGFSTRPAIKHNSSSRIDMRAMDGRLGPPTLSASAGK
jgi:hypothetical protein